MTLKRTDQIDLEVIDEKYQTKRMLTLAQKEFRHKNIVEAVSVLHSAIEKHLFVAWTSVILVKFGINPFVKMRDEYSTYFGFKELANVLYQTGLINKEIFRKLIKFNSLRNVVIHEMMKLESVRKKSKLENIKNEFTNGVDCYNESKKLRDKYRRMVKYLTNRKMKQLQHSLSHLSDLAKKVSIEHNVH